MKKILLGVAGMVCGLALVFSIAAPAQAAALTSAQVQAIIGLLQSFGADASIVANVQATLTGTTQGTYPTYPVTGTRCPQIGRTLSQGASGSDVVDLQAYLGVSQTGYFGLMTAQAVASFQASEGLSQVGIVGPQTRAAFARRCGGGTGNVTFSASPTYGAAPLTVTFSITAEAGEYSVEFGDGQSATVTLPAVQCFRAPCNTQTKVAHTYTSNGTYLSKLMYQPSFYCPPGAMCPQMMPAPKQVGTATITVRSSTSGGVPSINGLDSPTSLSVGQTGTWTVHATAPSGTQLRYSVVWGDEGWGTSAGSAQYAQANVQTSATFSHTYQHAGTYNPTFTVSNDYGSVQTSASVVVGGSSTSAIRVLSPNGGESWPIGSTQTIRWTAPSMFDKVTITFYTPPPPPCYGTCPLLGMPDISPTTIAQNVPNTGSYTWTLTNPLRDIYGRLIQPGSYRIQVSAYSNNTSSSDESDAPFSITGTNAGTPVISGVSGPTSLVVGQQGTWTVQAQNSTSQLWYTVKWGDEPPPQTSVCDGNVCTTQTGIAYPSQSTGTFTHTYNSAGTYTPTFTVSNDIGSAQASASVVVSNNSQTASFSATPTSGTAPLAVAFSVNSVTGYDLSGFSIDFGDGQTGNPQTIYCFAAPCNPAMTASHTYAAAGTYYAKLMYQPPFSCPAGAYCTQMMPAPQVVGTATITVTGATSNVTFSASPQSGWAPLGVTFTTNVSGAVVDFGDGASAKVESNCTAGFTGSTNCNTGSYFTSHYYQSAGTYTATIKRIIGVREIYGGGDTNIYETIGTVTITVMTGWL